MENYQNPDSSEPTYGKEVAMLHSELIEQKTDTHDVEAIEKVAFDLFGSGYPEHEVHKIVEAFSDSEIEST
jgi:hypothetical protein